MKSSLDYLIGPDEASGDTRQKNSGIVPAKDSDTQKILKARLEAVTDAELTDGARNLFTFLLDLALNPRVNNDRRGEITISNTQLREWLDRSARAIYGWTKELVKQRHVWVSKLPRPNMHPMNVFHITALQPIREMRQDVASDGLWGNGYRRPDQVMPLGARGGTCTKRHCLLDQFGRPANTKTLENSPPTRKECTPPPQILREGPAQNDTCHPQILREAPAQNDTRPPQNLRGAPAKNVTSPTQKPAVLIESQIETETPVQKGEGGTTPPDSMDEALKDAKWARWLTDVETMFPSKRERLRDSLKEQLKALEADPKSADLSGAPLKPSSERFLEKLRKEIVELQGFQSEDAKRVLARRNRELAQALSDPKNYEHVLTPVAAKTAQNLRRRIRALNEYIEGPSV
jgi:hypothetical protein